MPIKLPDREQQLAQSIFEGGVDRGLIDTARGIVASCFSFLSSSAESLPKKARGSEVGNIVVVNSVILMPEGSLAMSWDSIRWSAQPAKDQDRPALHAAYSLNRLFVASLDGEGKPGPIITTQDERPAALDKRHDIISILEQIADPEACDLLLPSSHQASLTRQQFAPDHPFHPAVRLALDSFIALK